MCFIVKCLFDLTEILRSMGRDMEGKKLSWGQKKFTFMSSHYNFSFGTPCLKVSWTPWKQPQWWKCKPVTADWWPAAELRLTCVAAVTESLLIWSGVGAVRDQQTFCSCCYTHCRVASFTYCRPVSRAAVGSPGDKLGSYRVLRWQESGYMIQIVIHGHYDSKYCISVSKAKHCVLFF